MDDRFLFSFLLKTICHFNSESASMILKLYIGYVYIKKNMENMEPKKKNNSYKLLIS